ncbi:hypothetical protein T265_06385 [Opisthorchis viverrini]|uniref:Uncharacterized protein n=1 Tax=Opisthorchis viverrini TaxID=6198 RepID=A0A074ZSJ3_OPIVI|nr:hypothetical protein T265_06385 [Opisthorchis viverrini]KER26335.1 hypothetical protein T265_06385 [Opisthorchis viverrini]
MVFILCCQAIVDRLWLSSTLHVVVRKKPFEEVGRLTYAAHGQASANYAVRNPRVSFNPIFYLNTTLHVADIIKSSWNPIEHPVTRRKHEGWDTARFLEHRQGNSRDRGRRNPRVSFNPIFYLNTTLHVADIIKSSWNPIEHPVRGSNPTSTSRLPLSRLGQPGSILALVKPSGGVAVRPRKGATAATKSVMHLGHSEAMHQVTKILGINQLIQFISYDTCAMGTLVPAVTVSITGKRECGTYSQAFEAMTYSVCTELQSVGAYDDTTNKQRPALILIKPNNHSAQATVYWDPVQ